MVIAVLADIVGSRRLDDRTAAQRVLDDTIAGVEADLPLATQPLTPTVGDEQQGVYLDLGDALVSLLMIQLRLPDGIAFRFGIGVGEVRPVESVHGELADGPGWYAAGPRSRPCTRARDVPCHARGPGLSEPRQDEVMESTIAASNAYLLVRDELVGAMSERERRLTYGRLLGRSQQELAAEEGITQPSVSKSLRTAGTAALIEGVAALRGERA